MIRNNKVGSWSDCRELVVGAQGDEVSLLRALGSSPVLLSLQFVLLCLY